MYKKKVLITYEYFLPAYKAGGPIQSIANLCRQLKNEYRFFIVCNNREHNEKEALSGIKSNEWNDFENATASVYYISKNNQKLRVFLKLIKEIKPDHLFINGIFSPYFNLVPLLYSNCNKILSARGMLHTGALSQKSFKKNIYISFLKFFGISKKVTFHATDLDEEKYIRKIFGPDSKVVVVQNFSNINNAPKPIIKESGSLRVTSIALISPMKNHALVLQALQKINEKVEYDIYGPVKDIDYWNNCLQIIETLPDNISVSYKGSLKPSEVGKTIAAYHYFILPSKSENFGHAIFEALTAGKPVITSFNTPWNDLERNCAGINVDIEQVSSITKAIMFASLQSNDDYQVWSKQAKVFAEKKMDVEKIKDQYRQLFN